MEGILNSGGSMIAWLQNLGSWLIGPMEFFSFLGTEEFYLMIAPAILWCWDAKLGLRLGLFLMINASFNSIFKLLCLGPRPYWIDERVVGFASETSFGVPSGHSQNAVVVWATLANRFKKGWIWIVACIIIFLIGISRLVLGVHFPHDVLLGWLLGGLMLWLLMKTSQPIVEWLKRLSLSRQLLTAFLGSLALILIGILAKMVISGFTLPLEWAIRAADAFPDEPINPLTLSGLISNAGAFFGLSAGALWLEQAGGFQTQGKPWQLGVRYLLGLVGVVILWFGLGQVLPRGEEVIPYIFRYLRYMLVGVWISGVAPYIFQKLNLVEK